ncbi:MAG TPA: hypothetical protein VLU47_13870 [Blastocatellia bacterium]|nr:hypothetical protein [Blastocatellia bacterium]
MGWEYKISIAKVLKGQTKLKFDTDEAVGLLNEVGRSEWELIDVSLVGSEAMYTFKRPREQRDEAEPLWK